MEAVYPSSASALARGRRARRTDPRSRHRTVPVTFAEIKEVDEESEEVCVEAPEERRRRPDVLDERLARQFAEFRRRREFRRRDELRERDREPDDCAASASTSASATSASTSASATSASTSGSVSRAGSEPAALHVDADT